MRTTVIAVAIVMIFAQVAAADYLACDLVTNVVASEVEVDGNAVPGIAVVSGQNLLLLDVSGLSQGPHQFRARLQDASGWWSDWSPNPLDASKPGAPGLRIVQ